MQENEYKDKTDILFCCCIPIEEEMKIEHDSMTRLIGIDAHEFLIISFFLSFEENIYQCEID